MLVHLYVVWQPRWQRSDRSAADSLSKISWIRAGAGAEVVLCRLLSVTVMADVAAKLSLFPALSSQQSTPFSRPLKSSKQFIKSHSRRRKKVAVRTCISSSLVGEKQKLISFTEPEEKLIEALLGIQGRGPAASAQQLKDVERAVQALEELGGVVDPTKSSLIEGRWQLMFTTRPGTASPIQRTFVGVDIFKIFQEISLRSDDPRVSNIVEFSDTIGELKVEAAAAIEDGDRILFRFDRAAFSFRFLPFKVPYPVPFRLLGDEAKGWLDTTYLSKDGNIRISRGNKCRGPHLFCKRMSNQGRDC